MTELGIISFLELMLGFAVLMQLSRKLIWVQLWQIFTKRRIDQSSLTPYEPDYFAQLEISKR